MLAFRKFLIWILSISLFLFGIVFLVAWIRPHQNFKVGTQKLNLNSIPGLEVVEQGSLQIQVSIWDSLVKRELNVTEVKLQGLKAQLSLSSSDSPSHSLNQKHPFCASLNQLRKHISNHAIDIYFENTEISLLTKASTPLLLLPKNLHAALDRDGACRLLYQASLQAPQLSSETLSIEGLLRSVETGQDPNPRMELTAQTHISEMDVLGLNQTILSRFFPQNGKDFGTQNGKIRDLDLKFSYFPESSDYELDGSLRHSWFKIVEHPSPLTEVSGQFLLKPDLFQLQTFAASCQTLQLSNFSISIPLDTPKVTVRLQGWVDGETSVLSATEVFRPLSKILNSLHQVHLETKGELKFEKDGGLFTGKLNLDQASLRPQSQSLGNHHWNITSQLSLKNSEITSVKLDLSPQKELIQTVQLTWRKKPLQEIIITLKEGNSDHQILQVRDTVETPSRHSTQHRIQLNGNLKHLRLGLLQELYQLYTLVQTSSPESSQDEINLFIDGEIRAKKFLFSDNKLNVPRFRFSSTVDGTTLFISSQEVNGEIFAPSTILSQTNSTLQIRLSDIDWKTSTKTNSEAELPDGFDTSGIPRVSFACSNLLIDGKNLGSIQAQLDPIPNGIVVRNLLAESSSYRFSMAQAQLEHSKEGWRGNFGAELNLQDAKKFANDFGLPSEVGRARGQVKINLNWRDSLFPSLELAQGHIAFSLTDGAVTSNGNPLHSLFKLISMDFGDLFGKDYQFKKFDGNLVLHENSIQIKRAKVKLKPVTLEICGNLNTEDRKADLIVEATPKVDRSLLGIIFSVFTKGRLSKPINWLFTHQYKIQGPLDNLKLKFHKMGHLVELEQESIGTD